MDGAGLSGDFEIARSQTNGIRVLRLAGEFDLSGVAAFERELARDPSEREDTLVLDLRGLTFIDSSGLRAVVMADHRARAKGKRCLLVRGPQRISRVFDLTGVSDRLELVDEPPDAAPRPNGS
jgi:anti-sigma B factor antagonist